MKAFRGLCIAIIAVFLVFAAVMNIVISRQMKKESGYYRVEAKRLADEINDTGEYDISGYSHLTGVFTEDDGDLYKTDRHYLIIEAGGRLYRVEYDIGRGKGLLVKMNCILAGIMLLILALLLYIRKKIILPFIRMNEVPRELAKGNLAVPVPEEKSRFFGYFTWSVNLLRETIENNRKKEITMQKDKKLLLLSLSHDIKTPLSAIKLNAKALAKGLYKDEEKRREAAESINARADEIESFVKDITTASSQDFMNFDVIMGEAFLNEIIKRIIARYAHQLDMTGTELIVQEHIDCLLVCDPDRLAECLQNLIENAIKYGDGRLIELKFEKMDGCELITVSNTGCSLEAKELTQIFESFHRGSNSEKVQGNGLGLFICKKLMSQMNGDVYADISDGRFNATLVVKMA